MCEKSADDHSSSTDAAASDANEDVRDEGKLEKTESERTMEGRKLMQQDSPDCNEGQQQQQQEEVEEANHLVENIKINDPRRGTEIKLLGLRLGENTATVVAQQITVCLQCNR